MNAPIIPSPDSIPVHWAWFEILLLVTFFIHLILMNFLLGGSLLTVWDLLRGRLEKKTSVTIPTLVALTVNFGVPPLLFIQVMYGHFFYTSSLLMAIPWIFVIPVLILAYYGAYLFTARLDHPPVWSRISLIITSLFLLYVAFMFVNNSTLSLTPEKWGNLYFQNPGGGHFNFAEPTLIPRYLHFIIAALGIGALGRAIFYRFSRVEKEVKTAMVRRNLKIFGWMTLLQLAAGTWFWLSMPDSVWKFFMGGSILATILMTTGLLLALLILHAAFTGRFTFAMILGGVQVFLMVFIRDLARRAYLADQFHPSQLTNVKELSPMLVFLLVFLAGGFVLYYMIRLMSESKTQES